jgi:hypothetical protein
MKSRWPLAALVLISASAGCRRYEEYPYPPPYYQQPYYAQPCQPACQPTCQPAPTNPCAPAMGQPLR